MTPRDTAEPTAPGEAPTQPVRVRAGAVELAADLVVPAGAAGVVLFAHGSGSGRHSPRNQRVARALQQAGHATLLFDLLTEEEEHVDRVTSALRFDVELLAARLVAATDWLGARRETAGLRVGYFGASTGGGAALVAATARPDAVAAVVSRGGRPDLAGAALGAVRAPTLLVVGGRDTSVLTLNRAALAQLVGCDARLEVVSHATHLFEEPGALARVAALAAGWFDQHLVPGRPPRPARPPSPDVREKKG